MATEQQIDAAIHEFKHWAGDGYSPSREQIRRMLAAAEKATAYYAFDQIVKRAKLSAHKAATKFPQPNYVALKIAEEAGEVVRGCVHYAEKRMEWSEVEGEIVQLVAMLIRLVTEGDQINGIFPPTPPEAV